MNSQFNYSTFVELFLKLDEGQVPSALSQCPVPDIPEKISEPTRKLSRTYNPVSPPA